MQTVENMEWLADRRHNVYSQDGEDGILEAIFERIGTTNRHCFEVGAGDGILFSNTRRLIEQGWKSVQIESDDARMMKLSQLYSDNRDVSAVSCAVADQGNYSLDSVLPLYDCPDRPDLGVIDIDGQDYYVWNAMLRVQPRVMVVEFAPGADPEFIPPRGGTGQAGAAAIERLGVGKGYHPVARSAFNMIFVRSELLPLLKGDAKTEPQPPAKGEAKPLILDVGAGKAPLPGAVALDRAFGDEAYPVRFANRDDLPDALKAVADFHRDERTCGGWWTVRDGAFDEIEASHVLEHFSHEEAPKALREWARVLKPGGVLRIAVPDFEYICKGYLEGREEPFGGYVMGGQTDADDFHKTVFDRERLIHLMTEAGLNDLRDWTPGRQCCASLPVSLNIAGVKGAAAAELAKPFPRHRKIAAVMSMPRLAFADNMFCALQSFTAYQIPFEKVTGAFWGPCMTRVIEPHLDDGTDWVVCLDYDTVFSPQDFHQLCVLMEEHPEADAIAPIQFKRDEDTHLFRPIDEASGEYLTGHMTLDEVQKPLLRVGWAHFGLTMIRASALRKMKRPWFRGVPDKDGRWGDERVDDDIYFWNNFRESGNKLYLATHVTIGHLQLMVSWAGHDFRPVHQYVSNYTSKGKPHDARR